MPHATVYSNIPPHACAVLRLAQEQICKDSMLTGWRSVTQPFSIKQIVWQSITNKTLTLFPHHFQKTSKKVTRDVRIMVCAITVQAQAQFHPVQTVSAIFDWVAVITVCFSSDLQSSLEHDVYSRLSNLQEGLIPKKRAGADDDLHRINELIQVSPFLSHRASKHVPLSGYLLLKTVHWLFQKTKSSSFNLS